FGTITANVSINQGKHCDAVEVDNRDIQTIDPFEKIGLELEWGLELELELELELGLELELEL
ncbi:hypothetical protein LPJ81_005057, partial [Coemansia sp. IMI 209127]